LNTTTLTASSASLEGGQQIPQGQYDLGIEEVQRRVVERDSPVLGGLALDLQGCLDHDRPIVECSEYKIGIQHRSAYRRARNAEE
jgi:hypothetical protein